MPVYNRAQYVAEAIYSILAQTYAQLELIIVDDGSTDETPNLIHQLAERDTRIRPLFLEHGGVARAMNRGVELARGELIARMDSDDIALPQRFAVQVNWMRGHAVDVCGSGLLRFGDSSGPLWFPETYEAIRHELLFRASMIFPTMLLRTEIYRAHPLDENAEFDDYALCVELAPHYRLGNVPQVLLRYRTHAQQSQIIRGAAFKKDVRTFRRQCFQDLFPNATAAEWARYTRITDQAAFVDRAELQRAGEWFAQLAAPPDSFLRQKMAERWRTVCRVSTALGLTSYRLYQEFLPQINPQAPAPDRSLWWACALRLPANLPVRKIVARVSQLFRRKMA